ncbi:restriction endonuclease subunit S [Sinorhizobium fredii]|uniref:restriction endonuclease subunit S n=1 Tax=Rhizobium fredii TaxID=380 RepID=UPI0012978274|nr:restriction endonuclease subunit S [Sinorhizobium fredii]MQW94105.1 restriction endonuclease subunit S [Sinorhizobium fredii]
MKIAASPTYDSYKDSGVSWLGHVPSTWELTRLGGLFQERKTKVSDKDFEPLSVTKNGIFPQLETAAKTNDGDNRKLVKAGDFVINSRSDRKGSSGLSPLDGSVSLINIVLRPKEILPEFCNHVLKSYAFVEEFYRMGHGIVADLWTTRYDEMRAIIMALPSPDEQRAIAVFLDEKCLKIDEAVRIKEEQIALLRERRQILIQEAVTRGLNPAAPTKDSGIDWIGQIPAHWKVKRGKFLFREINERSQSGAEELLSVSHTTGVTSRSEKNINMFMAEDYTGAKLCQAGDVVFNTMWAWMGALGVSDLGGIVSPSYGIYRPLETNSFNNRYLEWLLRSNSYVEHYNKMSTGLHSSRLRFYAHMFFDMYLGFPSKAEQDEIVAHIEIVAGKIDAGISTKEEQIAALKEYRTSLINAAVTGKIRVI